MGGFFSHDGMFYKIGSGIADIMVLGILWLLASIPLVTMGAATTAAYYVATKKANDRDVYMWRDFWRSFRQNFLLSTGAFLTLVAIFLLIALNIRNIGLVEVFANAVLVAQFFILVQAIFVMMYVFPVIARFEMGYRQAIKTAFFMANRHIFVTISNLVLLAAVLFIAWVAMPMLAIFSMGIYIYFSSFLLVRLFKKHRPDFDAEDDDEHLAPLDFSDTTLDLEKIKSLQDAEDDQ